MGVPIWVVDAFADEPFAGNPAAVCLLDSAPGEEWMQLVAREMNLSETAFLWPSEPGWNLRWFTPVAEVELCGHATLASAHILYSLDALPKDSKAFFQTKSGTLTARRRGEAIELDFPTEAAARADDPGLEDMLRTPVLEVYANRFDLLALLPDESAVALCRPDMDRVRNLGTRGLSVTAEASRPGFDFVSRFFAPAYGVDEDPVTGSAHCMLGPFWADRLRKADLVAYQASARGGAVGVSVRGERTLLSGMAVSVWQGELLTNPV